MTSFLSEKDSRDQTNLVVQLFDCSEHALPAGSTGTREKTQLFHAEIFGHISYKLPFSFYWFNLLSFCLSRYENLLVLFFASGIDLCLISGDRARLRRNSKEFTIVITIKITRSATQNRLACNNCVREFHFEIIMSFTLYSHCEYYVYGLSRSKIINTFCVENSQPFILAHTHLTQ